MLTLRSEDAANARRGALARRYREGLEGVGDLRLPGAAGEEHVHHLYVVRTGERDELRRYLAEHGVRASLHYPIPPHLQEAARDLGYRRGDFPVAEAAADTVLSLPIAPEPSEAEIDTVIGAVRSYFEGGTV